MGIKELGNEYKDYIIEQRRFFHQNPELAFKEVLTTAHIKEELESMGIEVTSFDDMTGMIAVLKGGKPGPCVLLRADMDALPVKEATGLPFASTNGNMHACGHDGHMAALLGAAKILAGIKDELCGTVKFALEPAEESLIGGPVFSEKQRDAYGSAHLVQRGILEGVSAVFGLHIWADVPVGKICVDSGVRMAAKDDFTIEIHGKSAHGAAPQNGHDAVLAASSVVVNLQSVISRVNDPRNMLVMTIGKMTAGAFANTVAAEAVLEGTARTFSRAMREKMDAEMEKVIRGTTEALGCTYDFHYKRTCSVIENDDAEVNEVALAAASEIYGAENIYHMDAVTASESFSEYMDRVPAHFAFVGARNEAAGMVYANHDARFVVDEDTLFMSSEYLASCAKDFLEKNC